VKKYFDSLIDTSGAPVVAASISVYNFGTTTLASLFADAAGATTLANPLTSSSAGYFEFYAADGRYTLSISVGGYPVTTISDILLDDPTNASATVVVGGSVDNSPIGASTPSSGRFTTLSASSSVSGTGFVNYMASPPAIGGAEPNTGKFTDLMTTSFGTNIVNNSGTTYTVLATDHTIVQKTVAAVYTLPSAASFTARRLHLVTQFMGAVTSASANVVPITGGSASTQILSSTDGGYAVLQSDGTNWVVIAKSENSGVFNVKDFGATGDGAANDTAAIQAAITAASVSGGTVYLPNGTYLVSSTLTITSNNVEIEGQSKGGVIITRSGDYGHTFDFHGNSGTGAALTDCSIKSMTIKSTGLTTSGAHINFVGVTRSNISDIYFYNGFVGMQLNGSTACTVSDIYLVFDNLYTGSATGRRYMEFGNAGGSYAHQSSGDIFVSNFNLRGTTTTQFTEFGINILSADGIWFNNGHVGNASSVNLHISGGTTEILNLVYFDTVMFDEGALYSLLIEGSLSTDFRDIKFDNCNFKSGGAPAYCDYGIVVAPACTVQHLLFSNCTVSEFGIGGVVLQSIASRLVKFEGCHVFGNGRDSSGTQPGYNVSSGVQDLEISGGLSGRLYNGTGTGTQSYGIQFGGSHTNVRVVGVDLTGNVTKSLIGAETVYVSDCLLQDSTTVASASTVTLPNSGSVFHISGTTTIDNIQVTTPGRNVILIFDGVLTVTDAGNKKLVGAMTTAAWSTLSLVYDGTWWVETSRSAT